VIKWETNLYDGDMAVLMEIRSLTVELPTGAGGVRPVNGVTLGVACGCARDSAYRPGVIFFVRVPRSTLSRNS